MCAAGIGLYGCRIRLDSNPTIKGVYMLDVAQETLEKLLAENNDFRSMYQRHAELNKKVDKAGRGELPLSDNALAEMKKEKLALKDRMTEIIRQYR
jgi:uncharacterized protein YdcH (DUF465 family)